MGCGMICARQARGSDMLRLNFSSYGGQVELWGRMGPATRRCCCASNGSRGRASRGKWKPQARVHWHGKIADANRLTVCVHVFICMGSRALATDAFPSLKPPQGTSTGTGTGSSRVSSFVPTSIQNKRTLWLETHSAHAELPWCVFSIDTEDAMLVRNQTSHAHSTHTHT